MYRKYQYETENEMNELISQNSELRLFEIQNITEGNFLIFTDDKLPIDTPIDVAKQIKTKEINDKADLEISAGFLSDALGTTHNYMYDTKFQAYFQEQAIIQGSSCPDDNILWLTNEGMISHTSAQFDILFRDAKNHKKPIEYKRLGLLLQIQAATTNEEAESILW